MSKNKRPVFFAVTHAENSDYGVFTATLCQESTSESYHGWEHANLCHLGWSDDPKGGREPYGLSLAYRSPFDMDLGRMEKAVKFLRSVNRKMSKIEADYGYTSSAYDLLRRYAKVLNVKGWVYVSEDWRDGNPARPLDSLPRWAEEKAKESTPIG